MWECSTNMQDELVGHTASDIARIWLNANKVDVVRNASKMRGLQDSTKSHRSLFGFYGMWKNSVNEYHQRILHFREIDQWL